MQVLPFVQVKDLAPSASFYAAIAQPLGLRYISASSSSIVFGDSTSPVPEPVFELKQNAYFQPLKPCRLILSASSPSAVSAFHTAALRANPSLEHRGANVNYLHLHSYSDPTGESCARIQDRDGNIMEVVHGSIPDYAASHAGSAVRRHHHSSSQVSRVLDWNLDVGTTSAPSRSVAGSTAPSSTAGSRATDGEPYTFLRKSVTSSTSTVEAPSREDSKGLSATSMVGSLLGVAVGAAVGGALTYTMLKGDREPQAYEAAPPFTRRQTYPDNYSDNRPRYYPPTSYGGGYSQAGGPKSRAVEEIDDRASRHSSHYTTGSRSRGRSEAGSTRRPLMIADHEHRSNASSKHSDSQRRLTEAEHRSASGSKHSSDNRSHAGSRHSAAPTRHSPESDYRSYVSSRHASPRHRDAEAESYVSARSDKSAGTVRPVRPSAASVETAPPSRASSRAPSRYSAATVRPAGPSRVQSHQSYIAARNVPLPGSYVGSSQVSQVGWDDDACSVAPSDSISNIGNRYRRSQRA
ncbi:hypothetical protein F5Y05DRAFT_170871 [Hypoxylon sp. FL0543]|nr:hypothetical protein F5Y05DRAFT_170871 [Hypoxylon sp. FL0543]